MAGGLIRGKIAQVLNARQIIINRGRDHGVTPGMKFAVLDLSAADVRDPDTNEVLGSLFFEKARVEVARVEPKISLAQTYELVYETGGLSGVAGLFTKPHTVTFRDPGAPSGVFNEPSLTVKRGDTVEQLPPVPPPIARNP